MFKLVKLGLMILLLVVLIISTSSITVEAEQSSNVILTDCDGHPRLMISYEVDTNGVYFSVSQCQSQIVDYQALILISTDSGGVISNLDINQPIHFSDSNLNLRVCPGFALKEHAELYCSTPFGVNTVHSPGNTGTCIGSDPARIQVTNSLSTSSYISPAWGTYCFAPIYDGFDISTPWFVDWRHDWIDTTCYSPFGGTGCWEEWNTDFEVLGYGYGSSGLSSLKYFSDKNNDGIGDDTGSTPYSVEWDSNPVSLSPYGEVGRWQKATMTSDYYDGVNWYSDFYQFVFMDRAPLNDMGILPNSAPLTYMGTQSLDTVQILDSTDFLCTSLNSIFVADSFDYSILRGKEPSTVSFSNYNGEIQLYVQTVSSSLCAVQFKYIDIDVSWDISIFDGSGFTQIYTNTNTHTCRYLSTPCLVTEPMIILGGGPHPNTGQGSSMIPFSSGGVPVYEVMLTVDIYLKQQYPVTGSVVTLDQQQSSISAEVMVL